MVRFRNASQHKYPRMVGLAPHGRLRAMGETMVGMIVCGLNQ